MANPTGRQIINRRSTMPFLKNAICHVIITLTIALPYASADTETDLMLVNACVNCHTTRGSFPSGHIPNIAGLSRERILHALTNFKNQTTASTIMNRIMSKYEKNDMDRLSTYYSSLPIDNNEPSTPQDTTNSTVK